MRALAQAAGLLLAACAIGAILSVVLSARALNLVSSTPVARIFWVIIALDAVQILCIAIIWRAFLGARKRFAERLRAVTGGLDDLIFLADASGTPFALLTEAGWSYDGRGEWLQSVHPEDRARWPLKAGSDRHRVELRLKSREGSWRWHRLRAVSVRGPRGNVREWVGTIHDIHEQKLANEHRDLVIGELRHRLKNLVTVVDALAKNSRRRSNDEPGVESFLQRFLGRLHALGTAGDIFLAGGRKSVEIGALVRATLTPFMSEAVRQRFHIAGPTLLLPEELAASLGLAVHELATNALKYGALSVPEGSVALIWSVNSAGDSEAIAFVWKERGGPPPSVPDKPGFGTRMIKSVVAREKAGRVDISYESDGVLCRIQFERDAMADAV